MFRIDVGGKECIVLDASELSRIRGRISLFLILALVCTVVGASTSVMVSDAAYTLANFMLVGMAVWIVRWARCSALVWRLIVVAMVLVTIAQILDITENFEAIRDIPIIGNGSRWNGRLGSLSFLAGLVITYATLMFALVEARLGRIAHEQYGLLAENISDVIFTADLDLKYRYISPSVYRLLGFTVEEALRQTPEETMTPAAYAKTAKLLAHALEGARNGGASSNNPANVEVEVYHKNGSTLWVETSVSFLMDDGNRPTGVIGVTRDISARKKAEDERRQLNERLTLAIRAGNLGVWDWEVATHRLVWDERMFEIYGVNSREFDGAYMAWRSAIEPEDLIRAERELQEAIDGTRDFHSHFRVIRPDGNIRHIESQAVVRRDDDGNPLRIIGMNSDITEQVEAESERARLQEQLVQAQKMESIGCLAGGVAHDFNNMLLVILGYAELAMGARESEATLQHYLDEVRSAALRSADLTRQLLAFARQQPISPRAVDLNHAVGEMLKMLERLIGEDIRLSWQPGDGLWRVKMDPTQLDQILANLCVNARDAISGGGEVCIETCNVTLGPVGSPQEGEIPPGDYVRLIVSDSGCGMDPATQRRIFEPFYTTKKLGKGTGLGLSTVYGIVKQNHGYISVKSELGLGTSFTVHLPRDTESSGTDRARDVGSVSHGSGHELILLVEDEQVILRLTRAMLEKLGYSVIAAGTPGEALQLMEAQSTPIQLLLTDVVMPEMNGRDLATILAQQYPNLRHLYMSGYDSDRISQEDAMGMYFLQKPFGIEELAAKVRAVLDRADDDQYGGNPFE